MPSVAAWTSPVPPIHTYRFDFGPFTIAGSPGVDKAPVAFCPRRTILDKLLVDAAAEVEAEVREGFTVEEVLIDDGRAVGIKGRSSRGGSTIERARAESSLSICDTQKRPSDVAASERSQICSASINPISAEKSDIRRSSSGSRYSSGRMAASGSMVLWSERIIVALPEDHPLAANGIIYWTA
jgi:hypothetical protein